MSRNIKRIRIIMGTKIKFSKIQGKYIYSIAFLLYGALVLLCQYLFFPHLDNDPSINLLNIIRAILIVTGSISLIGGYVMIAVFCLADLWKIVVQMRKDPEYKVNKIYLFMIFGMGIIVSSHIFSFFSTIVSISVFFRFLFYLSNWPSILLRVYPTLTDSTGNVGLNAPKAFVSPTTIIVNSIPWLIIGYTILVVIIKKMKKRLANEMDTQK